MYSIVFSLASFLVVAIAFEPQYFELGACTLSKALVEYLILLFLASFNVEIKPMSSFYVVSFEPTQVKDLEFRPCSDKQIGFGSNGSCCSSEHKSGFPQALPIE